MRRCLEFQPEPLEVLRGRYPQAIEKLIDVESVTLGLQYDPGSSREHVFDLEDGFRFIISREDQADEGEVIHVSVSISDESSEKFLNQSLEELLIFCEETFRKISNDNRPLVRYRIAGYIFHWFIFP